jgi:phosphoglycolate phosphatase-like HAD superfamily hydrolase
MAKTTLVLFDIDGTLLRGGGAGERALSDALKTVHGLDDDMRTIEMAGRTDSGIVRQIFARHGIGATAENISRFCDAYLHHLALRLPQCSGRLLPGIIPLLDALKARPDIAVALLTGNLARGAELKLSHFGVWRYFEFGAYADDHHDRNELGPFARARAKERHGVEFPPERIFVLGDTPHDIACARAVGARAVAVATGNHTRDQLAQCAPDFLLDDLGDLVAVMRIFDGAGW